MNQVDLLAIERVHQIGQARPVKVYRLVCSGSVEERMVSERRERRDVRKVRLTRQMRQMRQMGEVR